MCSVMRVLVLVLRRVYHSFAPSRPLLPADDIINTHSYHLGSEDTQPVFLSFSFFQEMPTEESDDDEDLPLAAKIQKTSDEPRRRGEPAPASGAAEAVHGAGKAADHFPAGCGPLRRLHPDMLLSIYSRASGLVAGHTLVCWYFYRVLASASRIHVELSAQTPNRLTPSLLRFVQVNYFDAILIYHAAATFAAFSKLTTPYRQDSSQQLSLSLSDSTALKTLLAVLASKHTRASVIYHVSICNPWCIGFASSSLNPKPQNLKFKPSSLNPKP